MTIFFMIFCVHLFIHINSVDVPLGFLTLEEIIMSLYASWYDDYNTS